MASYNHFLLLALKYEKMIIFFLLLVSNWTGLLQIDFLPGICIKTLVSGQNINTYHVTEFLSEANANKAVPMMNAVFLTAANKFPLTYLKKMRCTILDNMDSASYIYCQKS